MGEVSVRCPPLDIDPIGPSRADLHQLGVVGKRSWLRFGRVVDLDEFEYASDVRVDVNEKVGVVERPVRDDRIARTLIDTYLLGDARVSAAAGRAIEERARALRPLRHARSRGWWWRSGFLRAAKPREPFRASASISRSPSTFAHLSIGSFVLTVR